jgi:hypothetical protein
MIKYIIVINNKMEDYDSNKSSDKHLDNDSRHENNFNDHRSGDNMSDSKSRSQRSESNHHFANDMSMESRSNKTESDMSKHLSNYQGFNGMDDSVKDNNQSELDEGGDREADGEGDGDGDGDGSFEDDEDEYRQDAEILDTIMPERKIRFRILNFINQMRENYKLPAFYEDSLGNQAAMVYAAYLISNEKENEGELNKM